MTRFRMMVTTLSHGVTKNLTPSASLMKCVPDLQIYFSKHKVISVRCSIITEAPQSKV